MNTVGFWWPIAAIVSAIFFLGFIAGRFSKAWRSAGNIIKEELNVGTLFVLNDEDPPRVFANFSGLKNLSELKDGSHIQMTVMVMPGQRPTAEKTPTNME